MKIPKKYHCKDCGKNFQRENKIRSKYCTECRKSPEYYKNSTIGEYRNKLSLKNKHRSWIHAHVRLFARAWNKDLMKYGCQKCGYSFHVEMAHIKPISSFPDEAKLGIVNSPENILILCRNHHWELDHGLLNFSEIPSRDNLIPRDVSLRKTHITSNCTVCNAPCYKTAKRCMQCSKHLPRPNQRKVERPSKEELEKLVWSKPVLRIAKQFGISDKAVEKWCKSYGISKPPRGYWANLDSQRASSKQG